MATCEKVFMGRWDCLPKTIIIDGNEMEATEALLYLDEDELYEEIDNEVRKMRVKVPKGDALVGCFDIDDFENIWRESAGIEDLPATYWIAFR